MSALVLTYAGPLVGALAGLGLVVRIRPRPGSQHRDNI